MSELKVYKISGIEFDSQFYLKSEADKVIAELKAENERLRGESCKLTDGCLRLKQCRKEKANIADELRATYWALWSARANMARGLAEMCEHQFDCCGVSRSRFLVAYDKKVKPKRMTTTEWGELWRKVEQKCWAKAKEYE